MKIVVNSGRDGAEPIGSIAERAGWSRRAVERELEAAVLSGIPIVACEAGVYVATSASEVRAYAESLRGRIKAVQARISALEAAADRMDSRYHQEELWAA